MTREKTTEQVRDEFLRYVWNTIGYWAGQRGSEMYKLEGLAFSILSTLDGSAVLPKFIVAPDPHPSDREFHIEQGEDWYPENYQTGVKADIAGGLHELFFHVAARGPTEDKTAALQDLDRAYQRIAEKQIREALESLGCTCKPRELPAPEGYEPGRAWPPTVVHRPVWGNKPVRVSCGWCEVEVEIDA